MQQTDALLRSLGVTASLSQPLLTDQYGFSEEGVDALEELLEDVDVEVEGEASAS